MLILLFFGVLSFKGCGQNDVGRQPISGSILFDGTPMNEGTVRFIPDGQTKGPAAYGIIQDGFYEISHQEGVIPGTYRVEIEKKIELPFEIDDEAAYAKYLAEHKGRQLPKQPVPPKYNRNSELRVTITPGQIANKLDFDLKKS
ncbi:hypothetical protein A6X21_15730 [Planctopirus hydrillae]|uniref:Carboxypeptidase regulatory-like domain-containing protein n=2 Tax=Planctopirus hydrillae TaxID=1841610 RepID=A0A1C3EU77_9PLAN|nr:hypothetical protein A6X21_15730 [Planctopirus hydrillae]